MRYNILVILSLVGIFSMGCTPVTDPVVTNNLLTGTATKGPIALGTVTAYTLNADGSRGLTLATATTTAAGQFSVDVGTYAGAVELVVTGGSYTDEATGATVSLGAGTEMRTLMAQAKNGSVVAVTALTTMAAANAVSTATQSGLSASIEAANLRVATAFGLSDVDIDAVIPTDLTSSTGGTKTAAQNKYGAIQCGLTQLASDNGLAAGDVLKLMTCLAQDFSDGTIDGLNSAGTAVENSLSISPVQAMNSIQTSTQAFLISSKNKSGYSGSSTTITP